MLRVARRRASYGTGSPSTWLQSTPPARGRLLRLVFDTHLHPKLVLQPTPAHRAACAFSVASMAPRTFARVSACHDVFDAPGGLRSPPSARYILECANGAGTVAV